MENAARAMKTAILISGHMRSFERCLPTLHWHVFRHFIHPPKCGVLVGEEFHPLKQTEGTCDFFVSTEPDADSEKVHLLKERYPDACVVVDLTPQCSDYDLFATAFGTHCRSRGFAEEANEHAAHAPYAISVPVEAVLGQLWRLQRCWDFFVAGLGEAGPGSATPATGYDLIIRCRPDLWMESFAAHASLFELRRARGERIALTPWWGRFGGVNDRFALLGREAARAYFQTWSNLPALLAAGCPLHPESLIKASLEAGGCEIDDTLDISFSTLRANGERRFPEISAQDIFSRRS